MKYFFLICFLSVFLYSCSDDETAISEAQKISCVQDHFYYYQGQKQSLNNEVLGNYLTIGFDIEAADTEVVSYINSQPEFVEIMASDIKVYENYAYKMLVARLNTKMNCDGLALLIAKTNTNEMVAFTNYAYASGAWAADLKYDGMTYGNLFDVKVKDESDLAALQETMEQTNTSLVSQNEFMKDWFTLSADKTSLGDAMQMAQYFYETGEFAAAEPDFFHFCLEKECESIYTSSACTDTVPKNEDCDAAFTRWFYNAQIKTCRQISYSGCSQKGFATKEECVACRGN